MRLSSLMKSMNEGPTERRIPRDVTALYGVAEDTNPSL